MGYSDKIEVGFLLSALALSISLSSNAVAQSMGIGQAARASEPTDDFISVFPNANRELYIAPLAERPLGEDEGPVIQVDSFNMVGFEVAEDVSLALEEVRAFLAAERSARNGQFTIGQLQQLADKLTNLYRENGLILAHAFVPEQDVVDGRVRIEIMQGVLGNVVFEGEGEEPLVFNNQVLQLPFDKMMGQAVNVESVERALFTLADYPDISFFGMFRPGSEVGETELLVKIDPQPQFVYGVGIDNHGSQDTGEYRAYAELTANSPTGYADRLHARLQHSVSPAQARYGEVAYWMPKLHADYDFGVRVSRNDFEVKDVINQSGVVDDISVFGSWKAVRSKKLNLTVGGEIATRHYESEGDLANKQDDLAIGTLVVHYDHTDRWLTGLLGEEAVSINQGVVRYSHGFPDVLGAMPASDSGDPSLNSSRIGSGGVRAGGDFDKVEVGFLRHQSINPNHAVMFKLNGQYSSDLLVPIEQFSMGGPTSVRAYPSSQYLADSGAFVSLEYQAAPTFLGDQQFLGHSLADSLRLIAFADYAWGERNLALRSEEEELELFGAGLGLRLNIPDKLSASATVAAPLSETEPSNERDPQYFLDFKYIF